MTQTANSAPPTIPALDGMRGVAILLVFAVHYTVAWTMLFPHAATDATATGLIADMAFSLGNAGVDLFMCLSGYLIYDHLMRKPQSFVPYFTRRVRRIFPPYLIVLTIYVALMLLDPHKSKLPPNPADAIIYIAECALLIPAFFGREPIVGIAWSLTYEMLFYLILPLLIWTGGLRRREWTARVIILSVTGGLLLAYAYRVQFHERTIMFVGGMLAREAVTRCNYLLPRGRALETLALITLAIVLYAVAVYRGPAPFTNVTFPHSFARALSLLVAFSCILTVTLGVDGPCRRILTHRLLCLMGEISYSFYLLHNLTLRIALGFLTKYFHSGASAALYWTGLPLAFTLCLIPGLTLYMTIERPFSIRRPRLQNE